MDSKMARIIDNEPDSPIPSRIAVGWLRMGNKIAEHSLPLMRWSATVPFDGHLLPSSTQPPISA
jgi:hypothetical protein